MARPQTVVRETSDPIVEDGSTLTPEEDYAMHAFQTVVGMDVHKNSIAIAVLRPDEGARMEHWTIANEPSEIRKLVEKVAAKGSPHFCYEAGPCGYPVHR